MHLTAVSFAALVVKPFAQRTLVVKCAAVRSHTGQITLEDLFLSDVAGVILLAVLEQSCKVARPDVAAVVVELVRSLPSPDAFGLKDTDIKILNISKCQNTIIQIY